MYTHTHTHTYLTHHLNRHLTKTRLPPSDNFFKDLSDPQSPTKKFFTSDHAAVFLKEIKYVQTGYLSDPPGMNM